MVSVTLLSSVARSALVGAVATKLVDTLVSTKLNHKVEEKKWIRNTKFELFSNLTEEILIIDNENFEEQLKKIKKICAKIVLLVNDKKLTKSIEKYLSILIKYKTQTVGFETLEATNKKMINYLSENIKR